MRNGDVVLADGVVARITAVRHYPLAYAELVSAKEKKRFTCPLSRSVPASVSEMVEAEIA